MRRTITTLLFILLLKLSYAQTLDTVNCDAPDRDTTTVQSLPWFGNNNYLESFLDSMGYPAAGASSRIIGTDKVRYRVPIKFWVYRNTAGTGGPTQPQLQNYIDNLNRSYNIDNNSMIGFYMKCDIGFINDNDHLEVGDLEAWGLIQGHKESGAINIHITDDLKSSNGTHYRARFFGVDGIFLSAATYTDPNLAATIGHEVGHYFELDHTHQYSNRGRCRKEAIDRNKTWPTFNLCFTTLNSNKICEATGDFLRDTPADHDLSSNSSCNYLVTGETDPWGDHYETPPLGSPQPDTRNILSYNGMRGCRNKFSRLQIAVMLHSIVKGKSSGNKTEWASLKGEYDDFEMDNSSAAARPITILSTQERNFNQEYGGNGSWSQCDVDWVRFVAPCSAPLSVFTSAMFRRTAANTRLTLFSNALVQLAQNDDIAPSNQFSSINWNFVAGQQYFIRVENLSVATTGYYNLTIGTILQIDGLSNVCNIQPYSIPNLPAGSTVVWTASPSTLVSLTPTGNGVNVTRLGNGAVTLTATVSLCGITSVATKQIHVGAPSFSNASYFNNGTLTPMMIYSGGTADFNPICNTQNVSTSMDILGATSVTWTRLSASPTNTSWSQSGNNLNIYFWALGQTAIFRVSATNSCGTTSYDFAFRSVSCSGGGGGGCARYTVSPNPAASVINVQRSNIPPPCESKQARQKNKPFLPSIDKVSGLKVYDLQGNVILQQKYSSVKSATLNVSRLKPGNYYLDISAGPYLERQQFIIVR